MLYVHYISLVRRADNERKSLAEALTGDAAHNRLNR